jgi:signal transduction histidine kinase
VRGHDVELQRVAGAAQVGRDDGVLADAEPAWEREAQGGRIDEDALPNEDIRSLLRAVADMAAVAIDKARLFKETGQRLAEVSTLYTLAEQMTRVFDLNRTAELSVIILKHALDCSGCCLFLKEKRGDIETMALKASNGWNEADPVHPEIKYLSQLAQKLAKKSYPTYIKDILRASSIILPPFDLSQVYNQTEQDELTLQIRSIIIVPLVTKDGILGILAIGDARPDAFGQAEGRLLTIAAAQIATAIENIKLYDSLEKRAIELEVALKEVAEANRLKSEFVQNVSHELRTPLTFILSYIELMLEGSLGEIPSIIQDKLEIVSQKTQTITRLVEDIISLQKMEAGNLERRLVTPYELITRANHGAIANAAQYGLEITAYSAPNLPKLYIDIDRIGQVFDNLVSNAIKFSPAGSKIHITAEEDQGMVKFSIQDNGIGIPPQKLKKIFDRFYQVDGSTTRRYSGAGLGLAIIKQIIEAHGGRIAVESVLNEGTTFIFWLPIPKTPLPENQ